MINKSLIISFLLSFSCFSQSDNFYALSGDEFFKLKKLDQKISPKNLDIKILEAAIFHYTNQIREQKYKELFQFDESLHKAAEYHSQSMKKHGFFEHRNPKDVKMRNAKDRILHFDPNFIATGENIAQMIVLKLDDGTYYKNDKGKLVDNNGKALVFISYRELAQNVVELWMDSPGHRANILSEFNHLACGISAIDTSSKDGIPKIYITQNFGLK